MTYEPKYVEKPKPHGWKTGVTCCMVFALFLTCSSCAYNANKNYDPDKILTEYEYHNKPYESLSKAEKDQADRRIMREVKESLRE